MIKCLCSFAAAMLCSTLTAQYEVWTLEFNDPRFPRPDEQGLTIRAPRPEKMEVADGSLKIRSGQPVRLSSTHNRLNRIAVNDLGRFQIRLADRSEAGGTVQMEIQPFGTSKPILTRTFKLKPDGQMHEYRVDLGELASYRAKRKGCYLRLDIIPVSPGKTVDLNIDRISLSLSQSAWDRSFQLVGQEKLSFFDETIEAMRRRELATGELVALRKRLGQSLESKNREEFTALYPLLYRKIQEGRASLNRKLEIEKPEEGWRRGASFLSFGLNGYQQESVFESPLFKSGGNYLERAFFTNADGTRSGLRIHPGRAKLIKTNEEPDSVGWCGKRRSWRYRHESGKEIEWQLLESRIAPGVVITTDANSLYFCPTAGKTDVKAVYAVVKGKKEIITDGMIPSGELTENFILIVSGNNVPTVPWLITFQKRPERILVTRNGVVVQDRFRAKSFGVSCLYGARPLPRSWLDKSDAVWAQCRRLNGIMNAMPYECREYFKVDRDRNTVSVRNVFQYNETANEWGTPATRIAPLPPVLALAMESGHPAFVKAKRTDFDCNTVYGKYVGVDGNELIYTLPMPARTDDLFLGTDRYPRRTEQMNRMPDFAQYGGYYANDVPGLNLWTQILESWCSLSGENKARVATVVKAMIERYAGQIRNAAQPEPLSTSHIFAERTEPYSGISYCAYGWKSRDRHLLILHDTTDLAGFELNAIARYAQVSGDWQTLKKHYAMFRKIYRGIPCRMEWATMAVASTDTKLCHHIDMATDTYVASEAMEKIARGVGDLRTADLALYVAAKESIPITNVFRKRRYDMGVNNNWDWEKHLPELGYIDCGGIVPHSWNNPYLATSFIFGCAYSGGLIRLYRDFCKDEAAQYEFGLLEQFYPQWSDPHYRLPGRSQSRNGPAPLARHLMLRDMLGENTDAMNRILTGGTFEDTGKSIWSMVEQPSFAPMLYSVAGAMIAGREAPVKLLNWYPAGIVDAKFSFRDARVKLKFSSPEAFELTLQSNRKPDEVKIDGVVTDRYRFDPAGKRLVLTAGPDGDVELLYRGYSVPTFRRYLPSAVKPSLTEAMRICRKEFQGRTGKMVYDSATPLNLAGLFNATIRGNAVREFAGIKFNPVAENGLIKAIKVEKHLPIRIFQGQEAGRNILLLLAAPSNANIEMEVKYADGSTAGLRRNDEKKVNDFCRIVSWDSKRFQDLEGVVSESQKELIPVSAITVKADRVLYILAVTMTR